METTPNDAAGANPEMVTLARESRGLSQSELALRLSISQSLLSKIESGTVPPNAATIEALATVLDYPVRFFFNTERVYGPSTSEFFHRKRSAVPAKILNKIHAQLNIRRIHVNRLARVADIKAAIPRIDPDEFSGDIEEIARAVRAMWQLPRGPVKNVVAAIEEAGGIIIRMRFDTNKVDAVSWWVPGDPPMFVVNEAMPADRERMTLCHELGHLVMHTVARSDMEEEANRFAGAFLMPAEEIRSHLRNVDLRSLAALKQHWRVSMQALLVQAQGSGAIAASRAKYLWALMSKAGYRTKEPPELDFPKEQTGLLQELIDLHTVDLGYNVSQVAEMLTWKEHEATRNYRFRSDKKGPPRAGLRVIK